MPEQRRFWQLGNSQQAAENFMSFTWSMYSNGGDQFIE